MALFKRNFPLRAAMELSTDPEKLVAVDGMTWWVRRCLRPSILTVIDHYSRRHALPTRAEYRSTIQGA